MNKIPVTKQKLKTLSKTTRFDSYRTVKRGGKMVISRRRMPCACKKCMNLQFGECEYKHITGGAYINVKLLEKK